MDFPQRTSPRRSNYDYGSPGGYFVTICTKGRQHYFGEILDGKMMLNNLGKYCEQYIQNLGSQRSTVQIHEYVVMPNHVHILLIMSEFTSSMNQPYKNYRQNRRDDLFGRANIGIDNNVKYCDKNSDHNRYPNMEGENRNAKSPKGLTSCHVSLQQIHNTKYLGPTLGSIVNMLKGAVTIYAKSGIKIPFKDIFARQSRYHDRVIRNQSEYEKIKCYIQTNP